MLAEEGLQSRGKGDDPLVRLRPPALFLPDQDHAEVETNVRPFKVHELSPPHAGEEEDGEDPAFPGITGGEEEAEFVRRHELGKRALGEPEALHRLRGIGEEEVLFDGPPEEGRESLQLVVDRLPGDRSLQALPTEPAILGVCPAGRRSRVRPKLLSESLLPLQVFLHFQDLSQEAPLLVLLQVVGLDVAQVRHGRVVSTEETVGEGSEDPPIAAGGRVGAVDREKLLIGGNRFL
ncbi:MAG TPA: hypothetical protein VOA87_13535 [Thermoanaerobaculia bacterium]|nr:hypothetical protein [Thermoanaerobaculia bacterium]